MDTSAFIVVISLSIFYVNSFSVPFWCFLLVTYKFLIYLMQAYLKITIMFIILKSRAFVNTFLKVSTSLYAFCFMTTACLLSHYPFSVWSLNIFTKTLAFCC